MNDLFIDYKVNDAFIFIVTNNTFLEYVLQMYEKNHLNKHNTKILASENMMTLIKTTKIANLVSKYKYTDILPDLLDQLNRDYTVITQISNKDEEQYMKDIMATYPAKYFLMD